MKSLSFVLLSAMIGVGNSAPVSQGRTVAADAAADAARRDVLATDERRTDALRRGDVGPLREIYAEDYTLVTPAGAIQTKSDQITDLSSGVLRYAKIEVTERTVRVYGDVAILLSREQSDIVRKGQQVGGDIRVTRTYKRVGSEWHVISTHASAISN
jgi:ketosteroid isomerase-like protein